MRRRITLNVLPLTAAPHPTATDGALRLMTFADETPAAHFTAHQTGTHLTDSAATSLAHLTYDLLRAASLAPEASLSVVERAADSYRAQATGRRATAAPALSMGRPAKGAGKRGAAARTIR